ncbi:MAG: peptidylprolyl isomerase [Patescibacteria group bacterium]
MADEARSVIHHKEPSRFSKWPPLLLLLVFLSVYGWNGLIVQHWDSAPVRWVTAVLPIPAATVNGAVVTYYHLLKRRDVLVWLQDDDGQASDKEALLSVALDALIRQEVMEQLADDLEVKVSKDDLQAARTKLMGEMSDDDFKTKIKSELNMSGAGFTEVVLAPLALAHKLEATVWSSAEIQEDKRGKIDQAIGELAAGISFAVVAEKYSDDASASDGGDLGYLTAATLPEGWDALLTTIEGSITPVMETERAFVLAKVAWLIEDANDIQIRTQAIIVKKKTLDQVVDDKLAASAVDRLIE